MSIKLLSNFWAQSVLRSRLISTSTCCLLWTFLKRFLGKSFCGKALLLKVTRCNGREGDVTDALLKVFSQNPTTTFLFTVYFRYFAEGNRLQGIYLIQVNIMTFNYTKNFQFSIWQQYWTTECFLNCYECLLNYYISNYAL